MDWWAFINEYRIGICILLCMGALLFICIGHIYREQVQLALKRTFLSLPSTDLDWWSVSHFCLFGLFGFLIPEYPVSFLLVGGLFEFAEDCLSSDETTQLANCKNPDTKDSNLMCKFSINDSYWYSNYSDIYINLFGYIVGSSIRTSYYK